MFLINLFIFNLLLWVILLPFLNVKGKSIALFSGLLINILISSNFAIQTLGGANFEFILQGSAVTGEIPIRIDALSGWFILIINFVFLTGGFYGVFYMKAYQNQTNNLTLHTISFLFLHTALTGLCAVQNSLFFLILWEIMALSAFLLVIFEHEKIATIQAGINYLIQSHVSIAMLMLGFIWISIQTGNYDFASIQQYTATHNGAAPMVLFVCFLVGFAIKAGIVPFHTWLPYAHPAAPSHISGIMSGVIIKIGIFGILRMILLIKTDYTIIGYIILIMSIISGLYGVMLAIVQHNLKKLLAYHSIENIGIIGLGIGIGCVGIGENQQTLVVLGFAGALLHTLNHALFKSLLFYTAGIVYQATHTLNIEHLGGLIKKMPQTAALFLVAAIAICGIPPFNGFISEFLIYNGLYIWLQNANLVSLLCVIFLVFGLVMIGGLALLCFTKAFGIVFLGNARSVYPHEIKEPPFIQLIPLYIIAAFMLFIGVFPQIFLNSLQQPLRLFSINQNQIFTFFDGKTFEALQSISWAGGGFILLSILIFLVRSSILKTRQVEIGPTWGCGYVGSAPKTQYTAASYVRSASKLFKTAFLSLKNEREIKGIFPVDAHYETHPYDKFEKWLIDNPIRSYKSFMNRFLFLQHGRLQSYILYGILFIVSVICIPLIYNKIMILIDFLTHL